MSWIWHDLECGGYRHDLDLWRSLARAAGGPVLDVGAGTGRIALDLAASGHAVTALDRDDDLLGRLRARAAGLAVRTVTADARTFTIDERFALCIVPMQTIQLLGGPAGRASFLDRVREHLRPGGRVALALADELELFDVTGGGPGPLPDVREVAGTLYSSRAVAVREDADGFVLERVRETVTADGELSTERDLIHLDRLDAETLEREGSAAGLVPGARLVIPATAEFVGSTVVTFDG